MESTSSETPKPKLWARQHFWGLLGIALLLSCVIGASLEWGRRRADPQVTFTVDRLRVNPDGQIVLVLSHEDQGPNRCYQWLKTGNHKHKVGSTAKNIWNGWNAPAKGSTTNTFQTNDPSSVHALVKEGVTFSLKPGMKKTLFEFVPQGPDHATTRYVIEVLPYKEMLSDKKP